MIEERRSRYTPVVQPPRRQKRSWWEDPEIKSILNDIDRRSMGDDQLPYLRRMLDDKCRQKGYPKLKGGL